MGKGIFERPIAHRGLHDRANGIIENSRTAFEAAIAAGFAIECDVQLTRDGVPVIFHDDGMERLLGLAGDIRDAQSDTVLKAPLLGSASQDCPQTFGQFLEQADAHARRRFRIVLEAVLPVGMVEAHREHGVSREGQAFVTRHEIDHAVPGRMAARDANDHARRNFTRVLKHMQLFTVLVVEACRRRAQHGRHRRRHDGVSDFEAEEIRRSTEYPVPGTKKHKTFFRSLGTGYWVPRTLPR